MSARGYLAQQLGDGLTKARERAGKAQREAARDAGMAQASLREVELGLANPTLDRIERLADELGVDVELTVTDREDPTP